MLVSEEEASRLLPGSKIEVLTESRREGVRVRDGSTYQAQEFLLMARRRVVCSTCLDREQMQACAFQHQTPASPSALHLEHFRATPELGMSRQ
ncbi:hypothetical protein GCM10017783_10390 [Deinococcus piscis]|uniref:Uncharacterized protein n=1 Tax=Deinococcus piscis TaxID=394230 RepID=A0ABQ3K4X7_9DEIO|nr:hypothetical protein GCM10017783_10390 [Deinococcus piscis]